MAQRKVTAFVDSQERLTEDVYSMWIREEEMAARSEERRVGKRVLRLV